ncbi:MAG TPA: hypothetical protein VKY65_10115 [Alphaproteobacteria bacterium]|nr:hypothetical protein [Alphaproteobacteria bacterium]
MSLASGLSCLALLTVTLILHGAPYRPLWWVVMALILAGAFLVPMLLARPVEWVIRGYLGGSALDGSHRRV